MRDFLGQIVMIIITILSFFTVADTDALDLSVINEPITTETAVVEIEWTNNTKKCITRPYISCVEKKIDGQWCEVGNKDYAHIEMTIMELPKERLTYNFKFSFYEIEQEPGEYRVTFRYDIERVIGADRECEKSIVFEVTE